MKYAQKYPNYECINLCCQSMSVCMLRCHIGYSWSSWKKTNLQNYDLVLLFVVLYLFVCLSRLPVLVRSWFLALPTTISLILFCRKSTFETPHFLWYFSLQSRDRSKDHSFRSATANKKMCKCQVSVCRTSKYTLTKKWSNEYSKSSRTLAHIFA